MSPTHRNSGFTLIELSIVLVVIGLIVGGIFVGQELINQAMIRAQMKQLEAYDAAVSAFRDKYNGIPGDLNAPEAAAFGFTSRGGNEGHGDGDQILEGCQSYAFPILNIPLGCEISMLFADLSSAQLIGESFTNAPNDYSFITNFNQSLTYYPRAKIVDKGTLVPIYCRPTGHYFMLGYIEIFVIPTNPLLVQFGSFTTNARAYILDAKLDDGMPLSGKVQYKVWGLFGTPGDFFCKVSLIPPTLPATCMTSDNQYNITDTTTGLFHCHPVVKMSAF